MAKRVKLLQDMDQAHFAKETVSSILKKAPPGEGPDKAKTPPRTPTKEGPRTPERDRAYVSPRTQKRECERQVNINHDYLLCKSIKNTMITAISRNLGG